MTASDVEARELMASAVAAALDPICAVAMRVEVVIEDQTSENGVFLRCSCGLLMLTRLLLVTLRMSSCGCGCWLLMIASNRLLLLLNGGSLLIVSVFIFFASAALTGLAVRSC